MIKKQNKGDGAGAHERTGTRATARKPASAPKLKSGGPRPDPSSKRHRASRRAARNERRFWRAAKIEVDLKHDPPVVVRSPGSRARYRTAELLQPFWPAIRSRTVATKLEDELAEVLAAHRRVAAVKIEAARRAAAPPTRAGLLTAVDAALALLDAVVQAADGGCEGVSREHHAAQLVACRAELEHLRGAHVEAPDANERTDLVMAVSKALDVVGSMIALAADDFRWGHPDQQAQLRTEWPLAVSRATTRLKIARTLRQKEPSARMVST